MTLPGKVGRSRSSFEYAFTRVVMARLTIVLGNEIRQADISMKRTRRSLKAR